MGRPEADEARQLAMSILGNGLYKAEHHEDALSVQEAELAMRRRLGDEEGSHNILATQTNLANTYEELGRMEETLRLRRVVYRGHLKFDGNQDRSTFLAAGNYATSLLLLKRFKEAKSLFCRNLPVARRVLGDCHNLTLRMRWNYARALYKDPGTTPDDLREAVETLEELERITRRVLGGAHPMTKEIGEHLRDARAAVAARETPPSELAYIDTLENSKIRLDSVKRMTKIQNTS